MYKTMLKNHALKFVLVGIVGALIEFSIFSFLVRFSGQVIFSNVIAFHVAFIVCYFLHYHYTHNKPYEGKVRILSGLIHYAVLMYVQLIIGTFLLVLFIDVMGWIVEIAKICQIAIVTPTSYLIQKLVIFKRSQDFV